MKSDASRQHHPESGSVFSPLARAEWWFLAGMTLFLIVLTSLPYIYAEVTTPPQRQFMGMMLDVPDHLQYFSWMRELSTSWLSANKMTPEPNPPLFFNLLWFLLGRISRLFGWGYKEAFQLLRVVAILSFVAVAYQMCAWFFQKRAARILAFLVMTFGSGFGWMLVVYKTVSGAADVPLPLTLYVAEPNSFLSMLGYPHFTLALLYVWMFLLFLEAERKRNLWWAAAGGAVGFLVGWMHAYDLILVYAVIGGYILLHWIAQRRIPWFQIIAAFLLGGLSVFPGVYSYVLTARDPIWQAVLAQFGNAGVYTPPVWQLPLLLGVAFVLAIFTVIADRPVRLEGKSVPYLFTLAWFLVSFGLVYLPVDFQIHMLNGWQIPIALLAVRGWLVYVQPWLARQLRQQAQVGFMFLASGALLLLLVIPTNLYLFAWRFIDLARHSYPYYLARSEVEALDWLEQTVNDNQVVLSSLTIGQYVPAETGAHAYLAHWAQTVAFFRRSEDVQAFYSSSDTLRAESLLAEEGIDYVFYGPVERAIGEPAWDQLPLHQVYQNSEVTVYAVDKH